MKILSSETIGLRTKEGEIIRVEFINGSGRYKDKNVIYISPGEYKIGDKIYYEYNSEEN